MTDPLARLAESEDWSERARAAQLIARSDAADKEAIVLRLLRDPDTNVSEAMVAAVLEVRREGAIPLILRSLRQPDGAAPDENDQCLLEGLLNSEVDGVDVRGTIVSTLLETHVRDELLGALAPSRGSRRAAASRRRLRLAHSCASSPPMRTRRSARRRATRSRRSERPGSSRISVKLRARRPTSRRARRARRRRRSRAPRWRPSRRSRRRRRRRAGRAPARRATRRSRTAAAAPPACSRTRASRPRKRSTSSSSRAPVVPIAETT